MFLTSPRKTATISFSVFALSCVLLGGYKSQAATTAATCTSVDLRTKLGAPQLQGRSGWCFAHTSADLISFKIGKRVSPMDLALQFFFADAKMIQKNKTQSIASYFKKHPDKAEELESLREQSKTRYSANRIFHSSHGLLDGAGEEDHTILLANVKGLCLHSALPANGSNFSRYLQNAYNYYQIRKQKNIASDRIEIGAAENAEDRIAANSFSQWLDEQCKERITLKEPLVPGSIFTAQDLEALNRRFKTGETTLQMNRNRIFAQIDQRLSMGQPVAIGYNAAELQEELGSKRAEEHSSLIAARKWQGDSCMYFVRDAYGQSCSDYNRKFQSRCEYQNGGTWVKENELNSVYSVVWIE